MTIALRSLTLIVLAVALSACGLLSGLIPDQAVDDPFRLDGVGVTLASASTEASALDTAATTTLVGTIDDTFVVEDNDIPSWLTGAVRVRSVTGDLGIAPVVTVVDHGGAGLPESMTILGASVDFDVSSGGTRRFGGSWENGDLMVVLTLACSETCTYTATPADEALLTMLMTGSDASTYGDVIATPGEYDIDGEVQLVVDADLPDGVEITIELRDLGGVVSF